MNKRTLLLLILISLLFPGCQDSGTSHVANDGPCPLYELPYPRPEPVYAGKLKRDFSSFAALLKAYTPNQAAARKILLEGKTIPQIQALLESGKLNSVELLAWDPDRDAFLVSQLRKAGAIILGKANLSEWANYMASCMPNGFSANGGQTQNPYGPFETYGSSSGSAVAVAADLTTVSVGSETQGSMIIPAGINSVVALKTSHGLVSGDYVIPLLPWQDVPGPMGRTVTDVAVLLSAMTGGVDPDNPDAGRIANLAGRDFTRFPGSKREKPLRVGIPVWDEESIEAWFDKQGIVFVGGTSLNRCCWLQDTRMNRPPGCVKRRIWIRRWS